MFWGTPALQFVPWWAWAWETLLDGQLPLWNPLVGMGAPLIANYQSALFYPPYWLYFGFYVLGGIRAMAWAQGLMVVLHLIWAGTGMAALTRRLGFGRLAQTVSGLAFSLSGYLVARAWFASINAAVAWLPWVLLMAFDAVQAPKVLKNWLKLGMVMALQLLSGHAQTTWYTLVLAAIWVAFLAWQKAPQDGKLLSKVTAALKFELRFGIAAILAAALAAVQLLPTAVYLMQSQRASAVEMEFALNYSFWPWRFLGLIAPDLFGSPVRGDFWGYGNFWEDAIYIGLMPFLLVLAAVVGALFRRRGKTADSSQQVAVCFLLVITTISFLLALGKNTPIFPWLYKYVPTFDMFQAPTRFSIWAVFCLALLAGIGVDAWCRPEGRGLYWTRLATAGAFAISLGAGLAFFAMGDIKATFIRATAWAGFWGLGAGVLALSAPKKGCEESAKPVWQWLVVAWISFDLIAAGWGLVPGTSWDFYTPNDESGYLAEGRLFLSPQDEDEIKYDYFLSFKSFQSDLAWEEMRRAFLPNLNMLDGVASVNNFDPLVPGRYAMWMESLGEADEATREKLLHLMGVGVVESLNSATQYGVTFEALEGGARVRWVPCAVNAEDQNHAWEQVFQGQFDPEAEVIIEGLDHAQPRSCSSMQGRFNIIEDDPNHLVIQSQSSASGWMVISDVAYPGWTARVDDEPVKIWHANYLFRAVYVEQGEHLVEFVYHPKEFYLGLIVSLMGWVAVSSLTLKKSNSL